MPLLDRMFGVEHEQFITHDDGTAPSHAEIDGVFRSLRSAGFLPSATDCRGRCLAVARETDRGPLTITTDCCTHILEYAFPPLDDIGTFVSMYEEADITACRVLGSFGIRVRPGGVLAPPASILWRHKANDVDGRRLQRILDRPAQSHALFHRNIPACIAATQVSIGMSGVEAVGRLRSLHRFEPLSPLLFGNSRSFNGFSCYCVRPLTYFANFPATWTLVGIPHSLPVSLEQYLAWRSKTNDFDLAFMSIRDPGRLEFRSSCSQSCLTDIVDLIRFRLAVAAAADANRGEATDEPFRERFIASCLFGPGDWCRDLWDELAVDDRNLQARADCRLTAPSR